MTRSVHLGAISMMALVVGCANAIGPSAGPSPPASPNLAEAESLLAAGAVCQPNEPACDEGLASAAATFERAGATGKAVQARKLLVTRAGNDGARAAPQWYQLGTDHIALALYEEGAAALERAVTLDPNAALVDGNDTSSAGVNIGGFSSGGEEDWNLGARLPPGSTIDTIHVTTVDTVDAVFASQYVFTVWVSDDNAFWTQVANIAAPDYDVVLRSFRLSLPPVSSQYVKVVNRTSPATAPAVLVSELRFFASPTSASPTITTHDETESATAALSYRVTDQVTLGVRWRF